MIIQRPYLFIIVAAGVLSLLGLLYFHLTQYIETYGITVEHSRPLSEPVPKGLANIKASTCGECHQEIYTEWQQSIHAKAWVGEYFQIDWAFDNKKQNCLNCHTPMQNQQVDLVMGFINDDYWQPVLEPNPDFDPDFQKEGVTCAACHVRNGKIIGPHDIKEAPHPISYEPKMRNGIEVCRRCHITFATDELSIGDPNICSTLNEIEANNIQPNCIDCHMPKVTRPLVKGYPARPGRHHYWYGGHTPAKVSKSLAIDINQTSVEGSRYDYQISLTNTGTHHKLPTGTPDRNIVVTISLLDKDKRTIKTKTHKIVRRILWRPVVMQLSDNRLTFNTPQLIDFSFKAEELPVYLRVKADYHFLEQWRRNQIKLSDDSHQAYTIIEKTIAIE